MIRSRSEKLIGHLIRYNRFLNNTTEERINGRKRREDRETYIGEMIETADYDGYSYMKTRTLIREEWKSIISL